MAEKVVMKTMQISLTGNNALLNRQYGFTLLELMVVMAIMALLSAVLIPSMGQNDNKLFQAQLRTLANTLNYNRRNAVIMHRPYTMTVFPYTDDTRKKQSIEKKNKGDWISQSADIQWQSGTIKLLNKPFKINYFPQGGATGGIIRLQQGRFIAHLTIDGITGKVTIKESNEES